MLSSIALLIIQNSAVDGDNEVLPQVVEDYHCKAQLKSLSYDQIRRPDTPPFSDDEQFGNGHGLFFLEHGIIA